MAPVRGGVKQHVFGPPLDAAIQNRLERFVMLVVMAERQIVAKQHKPMLRCLAQNIQQPRHAGQVFALQFHNFQAQTFGQNGGMHRLNQTGFAHATRAP